MHEPIAADLRQQLEALAQERGATVDGLLRELLRRARLETGPSREHGERDCFELAQASGVIGAVANTPRDLSSNPDRLDGFGRE